MTRIAYYRVSTGDQSIEAQRLMILQLAEPPPKRRDPLALGRDAGLACLVCFQQLRGKSIADVRSQTLHEASGVGHVGVERKPEAKAELGVILKERVRPSRPAPFPVRGIGSCGQITPIN